MIKLELGIRYLSQLKRIRPNDMGRFESTVAGALRDCGASVRREGSLIAAEFPQAAIALWLDIALALESLSQALSLVDKELLGRACVLRAEGEGHEGSALIRFLSAHENPSGIWCDRQAASSLSEYAVFRESGGWYALDAFKLRDKPAIDADDFWFRRGLADRIYSLGLSDPARDKRLVVLEGPPLCGKRQTLRLALSRISSSVETLRISFDEAGRGLSPIADALSESLWSRIAERNADAASSLRESRSVVEAIGAARLSAELAAEREKAFSAYFAAFVDAWLGSLPASKMPVVVVENVHFAEDSARGLLASVIGPLAAAGRSHAVFTDSAGGASAGLSSSAPIRLRADIPSRNELADALGQSALYDECLRAAASGGVAAALRTAVGWQQNADGSLASLHPRMAGDLLEIAYALSLSNELLPPGELSAALTAAGNPRAALPLGLARLRALGIIDDETDPRIVVPGFVRFAESLLGPRADAVRVLVRGRLEALVARKAMLNSYETTVRLVGLGGEIDDDGILDAVIEGLLRGEYGAFESAVKTGSLSSVVGKSREPELRALFSTRKALLYEDEPAVSAAFAAAFPGTDGRPRYASFDLLDRSAYALSEYPLGAASIAAASGEAKKALILLQGDRAKKGLSRAYRLLGEAELARERINEAIDYFGFAAESAESADDRHEAMLSSVNGAATQFLLGNISRAERDAADAERRADALFHGDWRSWALFMQGRIAFSSGRYGRAVEIFDSLGSRGGSPRSLFLNWRDRSLAFAGESAAPPFADESADASLFRIEAAFLRREYEAVEKIADAYIAAPPPAVFRNPERLDLSSGFAFVEDRAIGRDGRDRVTLRLVRVYRSFALAELGRASEAVSELHRIAREEPVSELDPYDAFYFWAFASSLRASGVPSVDWQTALSLAFKRLQRRSSRIDDAAMKRDYTTRNRWNAALYADAKSINLI